MPNKLKMFNKRKYLINKFMWIKRFMPNIKELYEWQQLIGNFYNIIIIVN